MREGKIPFDLKEGRQVAEQTKNLNGREFKSQVW